MSSYDSYHHMYALGVLTRDEVRRLFGVPNPVMFDDDPYLFTWEPAPEPLKVVMHGE